MFRLSISPVKSSCSAFNDELSKNPPNRHVDYFISEGSLAAEVFKILSDFSDFD